VLGCGGGKLAAGDRLGAVGWAVHNGLVWRAAFAYSDERQAAYATPPFPAPTPPGAQPVKALRARIDAVQPATASARRSVGNRQKASIP
jgi:hypothetical protein